MNTIPSTTAPDASNGICEASRTVIAYSREGDGPDERDAEEHERPGEIARPAGLRLEAGHAALRAPKVRW